jgi:hypothetical protein
MSDMESQLTDAVVMVTPDQFRWEKETADTNKYMRTPGELAEPISPEDVAVKARPEFVGMVDALETVGVSVLVLRSPWRAVTDTPAAVFPNNWFSHHQGGQIVVYPMRARVRRNERQLPQLQKALQEFDILVGEIIDLSSYENEGLALEGTGSLVLDRTQRVAFALESQRTDERLFRKWCDLMGYRPTWFHAYDKDQKNYPIYHTNVVMAIGEGFAVICPETITDAYERATVLGQLADLGKEIITITLKQLRAYCANILQLRTEQGGRVIVLSQAALDEFGDDQKRQLERHGDLVAVKIPVIEGIGGGSARCMLAEVFRA